MYVFTTSTWKRLTILTMMVVCLSSTVPAHAQIQKTIVPMRLPSPHMVAGENGGSRIDSNNAIVVCANDETNTAMANPPCRAFRNYSVLDYFMPWRSPLEYTSFQKALTEGRPEGVGEVNYCPPKRNTLVCGSLLLSQLGSRPAGYIAGDVDYYAVQDDVFGPVNASVELNNPDINYKTTFVCDKGQWVQTHSSGSCVPMDGKCKGLPNVLANNGGWPASDSDLCVEGSLIENIQKVYDQSGIAGWTWYCRGTPGRSGESCSATKVDPVTGVCGTADGKSLTSPPAQSQLCAQGTPSITQFSYYDKVWNWTCAGNLNGTSNVMPCVANNANPAVDGKCSWIGNNYEAANVQEGPKATGTLCVSGSAADPLTGTISITKPQVDGGTPPLYWSYKCFGLYGGKDAECRTNLRIKGKCNIADSGTETYRKTFASWSERPLESGGRALCQRVGGQKAAPSPSSPLVYSDETGVFSWACPGYGEDLNDYCESRYIEGWGKPECGGAVLNSQYGQFNTSTNRMDICLNDTCGYYPMSQKKVLCKNGEISPFGYYESVSGKTGWGWNCIDPQALAGPEWCFTAILNPPKNGVCGSASGSTPVSAPDPAHLCAYPTTQPPYGKEGSNFVWTCPGVNGGKSADCFVPAIAKVDASCGASNGTQIPDAPNKNLCTSGQPSEMQLTGVSPNQFWIWSCLGTGEGVSTSCRAKKCDSCEGSLSGGLEGIADAAVFRYGCKFKGKLRWTSSGSTLKNALVSLHGSILAFGSLTSDALQNRIIGEPYCPPCSAVPSGAYLGAFNAQSLEGSCSESDQGYLNRDFVVNGLAP